MSWTSTIDEKDNLIKCRVKRCSEYNDSLLQLHHIVPKAIGGTDKEGRIRLCLKHHHIITGLHVQWLWVYRSKSTMKIYQLFKDQTELWKGWQR